MHPTVRYMILCEDIHRELSDPRRVSLIGVITNIRSNSDPPYPMIFSELCVFLQLTECRGPGVCQIKILHADSEDVVFQSSRHTLAFGRDPLEVYGAPFRFFDCRFSVPGLYLVQFWYNEVMLAQQSLLLR